MKELPPEVFPLPRQLRARRRSAAARSARRASRATPRCRSQGYAIAADREGVRVAHSGRRGQALCVRTRSHSSRARTAARCPALALRDWPDFPVRGFMLDISSRPRPHARLRSRTSSSRLSRSALQPPHSSTPSTPSPIPGHEVVWRDNASPITADDVRWLDRLCAEHGIELAANQNTFRAHGALAPARTRSRAAPSRRTDGSTPGGGRPPRRACSRPTSRERRVRARPRARARAATLRARA